MHWNCAQLFLDTTQWLDTTLIVLDRHLTHCKELQLESRLISNLMNKILIYLHIIHLLKSSTCFEHYPCTSSGGLGRDFIYAASGIVTVCR